MVCFHWRSPDVSKNYQSIANGYVPLRIRQMSSTTSHSRYVTVAIAIIGTIAIYVVYRNVVQYTFRGGGKMDMALFDLVTLNCGPYAPKLFFLDSIERCLTGTYHTSFWYRQTQLLNSNYDERMSTECGLVLAKNKQVSFRTIF